MTDTPNQITPRHFAVLLILREIREVRRRLDDDAAVPADPGDLFRSQLRVWLLRTLEELQRAAQFLEDNDGT
jgi:hypothetical protein